MKHTRLISTILLTAIFSVSVGGCAGCKGCNVNETAPLITPTTTVTATIAPVTDNTNTPVPTDEVVSTATPAITEEVSPTEEVTPTEAVVPTPEPSPVPTATPEPTATPTPVITVDENATLLGSAKMGDNVWYDFYDDGTLVVRGTGKTRDINCRFEDGAPCYRDIEYSNVNNEFYSKVKAIIIEEGITGIGNWALSCFDNVSKISLPKSLSSIGFGAFYNSTRYNPQITGVRSDVEIGLHAFGSIIGGSTNLDLQKYATLPSPTPVPTATPLPNPDKPRKVATLAITDTITYEFWDNDVMYVKGTGAIPDQSELFNLDSEVFNPTGYTFAEKIKTVIVEEGITSFGKYCLNGLWSIKEWYLPKTLTSVVNSSMCAGNTFHMYFEGQKVTVKFPSTSCILYNECICALEDEAYALEKEATIIWE